MNVTIQNIVHHHHHQLGTASPANPDATGGVTAQPPQVIQHTSNTGPYTRTTAAGKARAEAKARGQAAAAVPVPVPVPLQLLARPVPSRHAPPPPTDAAGVDARGGACW